MGLMLTIFQLYALKWGRGDASPNASKTGQGPGALPAGTLRVLALDPPEGPNGGHWASRLPNYAYVAW